MNQETTVVRPTSFSPARAVAGLAVMTVVSGAVLFGVAGTVAWPEAWIYLAVIVAVLGVYSAILLKVHPDLVAERSRPPADAKKWDKPFVAIVGKLGPMALLIVCALDRRFGWSGQAGAWVPLLGLLMVTGGGSLSAWAVASNRFFSAVIRIQHDRGHHVIDTGPYRFVRHPGYLGSIFHMFGTALTLSSWWGLAVALLLSSVLAVRAALEDMTLQAELDGYTGYARRVRSRLVPGVW